MARTRDQWNTDIDAYAAVMGLSTSAVAEWKLLRDLCVSIAMFFENIFELFKSDVDDTLNKKQFGSLFWYIATAKEFQEGDNLSVSNGIVGYDPVDITHRIITQASARETVDGIVLLKVAKTANGDLVALSNTELDDFKSYMAARRSPGVKLDINSKDPDLVKYIVHALYDPLYDKDTVDTGLMTALLSFRDNFRFDAVFYTSELIQRLSEVAGVVSIDLDAFLWDNQALTFNPIGVSEILPSGYFNWSNSSSLSNAPAI